MAEKAKRTILAKILEVTSQVGAQPKTGTAPSQVGGFSYHAIDEVVDALRGPLAEARLVVIPSFRYEEGQERHFEGVDSKGNRREWYHRLAVCTCILNIYDADAPGDPPIGLEAFGEGLDTQDKAAGKACAYALKNAYLALWQLRGMPDPEAEHIEGHGDAPRSTSGSKRTDSPKGSAKKGGMLERAKELSREVYKVREEEGPSKAWLRIVKSAQRLRESGKWASTKTISEKQAGRLIALAKERTVSHDELKADLLAELGIDHVDMIPWPLYPAVCVMYGADPEE